MRLPAEIELMLMEMHVANHEREREDAARDPEAHKLTRVFPKDGHTRYRFYQSKPGPRMREVRHCWSTGRNAAGYFLTWRERDIGKGRWKRDQWAARKARKAAKAMALRRHEALEGRRGR